MAVSPDGRRIVSGSGDKTLKVWDLESHQELASLSGHSSSVYAVAFSPDGRRIVSGSGDKTLKVWDLESHQELASLSGHSSLVYAVAFSPDGRRIVSGSNDNTLKVWDLESHRELASLSGHSYSVRAVAVSPDGRRIVSGSNDNTLKVWDLESGPGAGQPERALGLGPRGGGQPRRPPNRLRLGRQDAEGLGPGVRPGAARLEYRDTRNSLPVRGQIADLCRRCDRPTHRRRRPGRRYPPTHS